MDSKGIEAARRCLPELVGAARDGRITIITRHGRPHAALVPVAAVESGHDRPAALLALKGCAAGVWGDESGRTVAALRDEWEE